MNNGEPSPNQLDDQLLDELRDAVEAADPLPDRLLESAKAAFVWRTIDEELAHLEFDSLAGAGADVTVRSDQAVHLSFATTEASISVEIGDDAVAGQVVPAASTVRVLMRSGEQIDVSCDEHGQFRAERPPSSPIRLIASFDEGEIVTEWFTLP